MPKSFRRPPEISTRLTYDDLSQFRELAAGSGLPVSTFLRQIVLDYLERRKQEQVNEVESIYAQQLRGSTNRICSLMAKVAIDAHAILLFLAEIEDSEARAAQCREIAARKIRAALTPEEDRAIEAVKKFRAQGE